MATFLLEVGTEELPASFVQDAIAQWRSRLPAALNDQLLTTERVEIYGTPRRLAAVISGLPTQQPDREEAIKGPPVQAAFRDGQPTQAAQGFARKCGVSVDALEVRSTDKGDFVFVQQKISGRPTAEILAELVPNWITSLEGRRFMRWGDGDLRFPRPIRWLVTLLDTKVLSIELQNGSETCVSGRTSQGHRVLHPAPVTIDRAENYVEILRQAAIEVDPERRQQQIQAAAAAAAQKIGGVVVIAPDLLEEVTNLVETTTAVIGKFDPNFLELPSEVIVTEMESHQRYFPVLESAESPQLLPYFITISNGDPAKSDIIAAGNERVIRARLADGKFFFDADRTQPLESYLPRLAQVTFQEDLGSVREKVDRIVQAANRMADQLAISEEERSYIQRTALLCKADLVTQMVGEFPELQGVMGQKYAQSSGEPEAVSIAIFEHYLPRGANDNLPKTLVGQVVGIADRLDTLVSIFSLGMLPSGSSDPFALRRAANAILSIIWSTDLSMNLSELLEQVVTDFATVKSASATLLPLLRDFFVVRMRSLLQEDYAIDYDLVNAVLGENDSLAAERALTNPIDLRDRSHFLQQIRKNGMLDRIYETVNRATRLSAQGDLNLTVLDPVGVVQPNLFEQPSEQAFYDAIMRLLPETKAAQRDHNYQKLVDGLAAIAPVISNFFDGEQSVLVMANDLNIRRNRLSLLGLLRNHAGVLGDFGSIVKSESAIQPER